MMGGKKDTSIQKKQNEKQEMMQEDNQKEKNQEQESWSEHFFAEMKNDENYAREEENEKERTSSYRTYLEQKGQKTKMIPSYGLSILLFLVVCGLGFAAFQNHQKMNAMETALMQMNSAKMTETETQTPASETDVTVKVESVEGNIIPQDNAQTGAAVDVTQGEEQTAENATQENGQTEATAEGMIYKCRPIQNRRKHSHRQTQAQCRQQGRRTMHRHRKQQWCSRKQASISRRVITLYKRVTVLWESAGKFTILPL